MNSRWTMWLHKWLALIIGVQVFIWLFGGFAMSALPIEQVRSCLLYTSDAADDLLQV